jgi:hypothetical protein
MTGAIQGRNGVASHLSLGGLNLIRDFREVLRVMDANEAGGTMVVVTIQ